MTTQSIPFTSLPAIGAALEDGIYTGLTTHKDGSNHAVVLLPVRAEDLTWQQAMDWAKKHGGELPTRPVAAMLFANAQTQLPKEWHWTCETHAADASYAWYCYFNYGNQNFGRKSYEGSAVAVRLIPLTA